MILFQSLWQKIKDWVYSPARPWGSLSFGALPFPSLGFKSDKIKIANVPEPESVAAPVVVRQDQEHSSLAYNQLKAQFRDIGKLAAVEETMGRDFLTAMPEGAWKSRLGQISYLQRRMHEDLVAVDVAKLLDRAKDHKANHADDWDDWDSANLHEMERMYRSACHVDSALIEKRARLTYEGRRVHREVLNDGDWPKAREFLSRVIDLNKQIVEARCRATGQNSLYQGLIDQYMPGTSVADIDGWFATLEKKLTPMVPKILERQASGSEPLPIKDFYPDKAQMWLNRALLEALGFDFQRGGLYETGHNPVEGGTPEDTRLVIKCVDTMDFTDSMRSTLHEGGHGLYIQGLPRKTWRYQPVGQDLGAAMQESQALLIDMIISRTHAFYDFLSPRVQGLFHGLQNPVLTADNIYALRTRVKRTANRRHADEITYFFHVLLRYRLEKDLVEGTLKIADLPEAWNAGMEELLGIKPESNEQGCLQDVHWFVGKFGYFPSYTLGHMIAAQLHDSLCKAVPDMDKQVAQGQFGEIVTWLRENIYSKGRLLSWDKCLEQATGKALDPAFLISHFERRYLAA